MGISTSRALNTSETEAIEQLQAQQQCQWDEERHLPLLMRLWAGLHPEGEPFERESWRWKKVGFQGKDPSTDFRGGGELALRNLLWFVETQPTIALAMMRKRRRPDNATAGMAPVDDAEHPIFAHYPWAATGINITRLVAEMACFGGMGLKQQQAFRTAHLAYWPLVASEERFNELYAVAFRALEQEWVRQNATYMQFSQVINAVKDSIRLELESRDSPKSADELAERLGLS